MLVSLSVNIIHWIPIAAAKNQILNYQPFQLEDEGCDINFIHQREPRDKESSKPGPFF